MKKSATLLLCMAVGLGTAQAGLADAGAKETRSSSEQPVLQHNNSAGRRNLEASVGLRDVETDFKPPSGYRQKSLNGKTVYCKKERISGTRFLKTYCFTQLQLRAREVREAEMRRNVARFQVERGSK